jgi:hypothetical protein
MSDEVSIPMSLPLDEDGFLRRECPTCEREFKCIVSEDDQDVTPSSPEGYYCPYCAVQAPAGSWWTKPQVEAAQALAYREIVAPELKELKRTVEGMNRSGGLIGISAKLNISDEPEEPTMDEVGPDGMRRTDFTCHPNDPVKALESWERPVHCMICGEVAAPLSES